MLLITILYVACHDSVRPEDYVKATKDVVSWSAKATAVFAPVFGDSLITVLGKVYSNEGFIREELAFFKIPPRAASYEVSIGGAPHTYKGIGVTYAKFEGDGHVISEFQTLDTFYQNSFSVDAYDVSSRTLKASFECRLMYVNPFNDTTYTVFKDGIINVAIEDY